MKYRLIKEYPGSPKLGAIVQEKIQEPIGSVYCIKTDDVNWIEINDVEKHPEFWEKLESYKILSFKDNEGKIYKPDTQLKNCWCVENGKKPFFSKEELLKFKSTHIYSIERLSDGEVFTVEDAVVHKNTGSAGQIHSFHIMSNGIWFRTSGFDVPMSLVSEKVKTSLFRTEDGVNVFEGDKFWAVGVSFIATCHSKLFSTRNDIKYFSTKEAAEKYISENKPKYSEKDMISFGKTVYVRSPDIIGDIMYAFDKWYFSKFNKVRNNE